MDKVTFPEDVNQRAEELANTPPRKTKNPGVYVIYDGQTGEPLYVGEAKNVFQRLFDHHMRLQSGSNTVREHVEADPDLDRETDRGAMWDWTEWAWINVPGGRRRRKQVEQVVESQLEPRYPSN